MWSHKDIKRQMQDDYVIREKKAAFGFRSVAEDEKAKWVRRHFNTVADKYDVMNTLLSFGIHYLWKRTAIKLLNIKPADRILDVCGGTGDLAVLAVKQNAAPGRVVLYDINRRMILTGRSKPTHAKIRKRINYIQGDAEQIAFADAQFDAVMVGFGIRNLTHMNRGFQEMYRVLKPGGKMICLEFSKPTAPLFRMLYDVYSFYLMPLLGWLAVGSKSAYTYLPESIRLFPLPHELTATLKNIGFLPVTHYKLTNGIAVIHIAGKPQT